MILDMRRLIPLIGLLCLVHLTSGQSIERQLFGTSGSSVQHGSHWIAFSLGEPITSQGAANGLILTQGFHQPEVRVQIDQLLLARAFLQGPYNNGIMNTQLSTLGYLPLTQPYHTAPWLYNGNEALVQVPANAVDWVLVELRSHPDTIVARRAGLLLNDGRIMDMDGQEGLRFSQVSPANYFLVIDHRNHMPVMTAQAVPVPSQQVYDLASTGGLQLYGGNASTIPLSGGNRGLVAGDINKNRQLKYSGSGNDRSLILQAIVNQTGSTSINTVINGYYHQDVNLNGQVRYSGAGNDAALIIQNLVNLTGNTSINTVFNSPVPQGVQK